MNPTRQATQHYQGSNSCVAPEYMVGKAFAEWESLNIPNSPWVTPYARGATTHYLSEFGPCGGANTGSLVGIVNVRPAQAFDEDHSWR